MNLQHIKMEYFVTAYIKSIAKRDTISKPFDTYAEAEAFAAARRKEIQMALPHLKTMRDVKIEESEVVKVEETPATKPEQEYNGLPFLFNDDE